MEEKIMKENIINQNQIQTEENNQVLNQQPAPEIIPPENQKIPPIESKSSKSEITDKPKPIQLVLSKNGILETTTEAINILTALKKAKLCIISVNGPCEVGKTILANNLIENEAGFNTEVKTEGIWLWNCPITLSNGNKLLVFDCQGVDNNDKISHKLFILSALLSTCMIYYTEGELNDDIIKQFNYFVKLLTEIKINKEENDDIEKLKKYFPELIFVNNLLSSDSIQKIFEEKCGEENIIKLFEKRSYLNIKERNAIEIKKKLEEMRTKEMQTINIDGDSLFCLLQNYIDFINSDKPIIINLAFENALLSKAKNISEEIFQQFKNVINKEINYPEEYPNIYKKYFVLQKEYFQKFCETVDKKLNPVKTGEYIGKIFDNMIIELQSIIEKNKEMLYEKLCLEYKNFQEQMNKNNISSIEEIKIFILLYISDFKKFFDSIKILFNENYLDILTKVFDEFINNKLTVLGETICVSYENFSKKYKSNIDNLNVKIKEMNEQIENDKKLLENNKKENVDLVKTYTENELKLKKLNDEMKIKISGLEDKCKMNDEANKKMTSAYEEQIKEKDNEITELKKKIEKIKLESENKINELNKEIIKLKSEIEEMKIKQVEEKTDENDQKIQTLFKKINTSFTEFREKVDNLEKNNEKILTEKINYKDEIDTRINNCKNDIKEIKIFCQSQIKEMEENYKKEIMRANDQNKDLPLELSKKTMDLKEQIKLKEVFENKLKESENRINDLNKIIEVSKKSLNTKDELIKMYQDKINNDKKKINDLEISLSQNIYNYKMAEDDFETLLIVFQGILQKDKEKYYKNIKKLSSTGKNFVISLVEKYNIFSEI